MRLELVPDAPAGALRGSLTLQPASGSSGERIFPVSGLTPIEASLPPGSAWRVSAEIPGFRLSPKTFIAGAAGSETIKRLPLWRLGTITGRARRIGKDAPPAREIHATLVVAPKPGATIVLPEERLGCPLDREGAFRCEVPAGRRDLELAVDGFVPVYRWGVQIPPGGAIDLGTVDLKVGASVSAWAAVQEGRISPTSAVARLVPLQAEGAGRSGEARLESTALSARVREDGFVQITGAAPGTYVLEVTQPGFAPARAAPIEVWHGAETYLQQPLILRRPFRLEVAVDPPLDWLGQPWHLRVLRASDFSGRWDTTPFDGAVGADGRALVPGQSEGRYWFEVLDSRGNSLFADFDVRIAGPEDAHRDIRIDLVTVRGSVSLGKEPLAATLWFGGRHSSPGVRMEADEKGRFHGVLPRKRQWRVQIAAAKPALEALRTVVVEPDRAGRAEVDIRLADTHLLGRVLDEQERPVARASVEISSGLPAPVNLTADESGQFETRGLAEGETTLVAKAPPAYGGGTSDPATVVVAEGRDAGPVELRVRKLKTLRGQVVSAQGPVAGAIVEASPRRPDFLHIDSSRTELDGSFAAKVSERADRALVIVSPPGNGLRVFDVPTDGAPLALQVSPEVGILEVRVPYSSDEFEEKGMIFQLLQDGLPVPWPILAHWASGHGATLADRGFTRIEVPALPPGRYDACFVPMSFLLQESLTGWVSPAGACATGVLVGGGRLSLEPRKTDAPSASPGS